MFVLLLFLVLFLFVFDWLLILMNLVAKGENRGLNLRIYKNNGRTHLKVLRGSALAIL